MFHGYNAFNLISEAGNKVKTEHINCPRVMTKKEWKDKLLRSPPLEYATVMSALPSKMDWDLHLPVVKTLFDNRFEPDEDEEEKQDLVWCMEKTPLEEYEYHEDILAETEIEPDYPEESAEDYTTEECDAFYDDNEFRNQYK